MKLFNNLDIYSKVLISTALVAGIVTTLPAATLAQTKSENYQLDNINFSTNTTVTTIVPKIDSTTADAGINTIKISDITYTSVLVSWKTDSFTNSKLEYGTTTKYGQNKTSASKSFTTDHTVQLTDLTPGVGYHLRIVATDEEGNERKSSDFTFETISEPKFISISFVPQNSNTVDVVWKTNTATTGFLTYKKSGEEKTLTAGDARSLTSHTTTLSQLIGETTYSLTITATDEQGKQAISEAKLFTTPPDVTAPEIIDLKIAVTRSGNELILTATWKTNEPAGAQGTLTSKNNPNNSLEVPRQENLSIDHTISKAGIDPSNPYSFKAVSIDPYGNKSEKTIEFVTPSVRKNILTLIIESITKPFGWVSNVFK